MPNADPPPSQAAPPTLPYQDDLAVRETYVEGAHMFVDSNGLVRLEFEITRPDPTTITRMNRRVCVTRLLMTQQMTLRLAAHITMTLGQVQNPPPQVPGGTPTKQ